MPNNTGMQPRMTCHTGQPSTQLEVESPTIVENWTLCLLCTCVQHASTCNDGEKGLAKQRNVACASFAAVDVRVALAPATPPCTVRSTKLCKPTDASKSAAFRPHHSLHAALPHLQAASCTLPASATHDANINMQNGMIGHGIMPDGRTNHPKRRASSPVLAHGPYTPLFLSYAARLPMLALLHAEHSCITPQCSMRSPHRESSLKAYKACRPIL